MSDTTSDGHDTGKPIYVLDGIAGVGKSTVAKTVAQRAAGINSLGASFFFSRDHAAQPTHREPPPSPDDPLMLYQRRQS